MLQPESPPFGARSALVSADLLYKLRASDFEFHLAGSYYFGVATPDSDVDLYAAYSPELVDFLSSIGFELLLDEAFGEVGTEDYTFGVFELKANGFKVHIQVFWDLDLLLRARDILAKVFPAEHTRTRGPDRGGMWHAAVDMVYALRDLDAGTTADARAHTV